MKLEYGILNDEKDICAELIYNSNNHQTEVTFTKEGVVKRESKNYDGSLEEVFNMIQKEGFTLESKT